MDGDSVEGLKVFTPVEEGKDAEKSKEFEKKARDFERKEAEEDKAQAADSNPSSAAPLSEDILATAKPRGDPESDAVAGEKESGNQDEPTASQEAAATPADPLAPLETVLHMPSPKTHEEKNATKPPHLQTPPYVHHFDTYTLVQQVEAGGFTTEQSITAMKAVRGLLALNLDVAKAGLVSKYDVENVSLFLLGPELATNSDL